MRELPPDAPKRIVKPRQPSASYRPVIAVSSDAVYMERTGEAFRAEDLPQILAAEPSSIIACQGFGQHLQRLQRVFGEHPDFQYRMTPHYRYSHPSDGRTPEQTRVFDAAINFVGFTDLSSKKRHRYHYPLDPVHFVRQSIDELKPDLNMGRIEKLLTWAIRVRDWCLAQGLEIKPSSGGLVAQLLRDPRFYPEPRRKVPRLLNSVTRPTLPGNFYSLHAKLHHSYRAIYLDQTNAHHFAAQTLRFPSANTLHAYGRFTDNVHSGDTERRARRASYFAGADSSLLNYHGVFLLGLSVPHIPTDHHPPPWLRSPGVHHCWVYSNELELVHIHGAAILGVIAAIVSPDVDTGLNRYARFAGDEIRRNPSDKRWLKPTLHSTYGILAARPAPFETGYYRANTVGTSEYPLGNVSLPVHVHSTRKPIESRLANVVQRGMIEAQVRKESLWFARFLADVDNRQVLAIYADSVFVRDDGRPTKLLPPPWRVSEHCTELRFYSATHFASPELTRLPGLSRVATDDARIARMLRRDAIIGTFHNRPKGGHQNAASAEQEGRAGRYGRRNRRRIA